MPLSQLQQRVFQLGALFRDFPHIKPPSHWSVSKSLRIKLFKGFESRTLYCFAGNILTAEGIKRLEPYLNKIDWLNAYPRIKLATSLFITTIVKNALLPLSLVSNARLHDHSLAESIQIMRQQCRDPLKHATFFLRNLLANACLLPGFEVMRLCRATWGDENENKVQIAGFLTALFFSSLMNASLKPGFTIGKSSFKVSLNTMGKFPGLLPIIVREACSLAIFWSNTSIQK